MISAISLHTGFQTIESTPVGAVVHSADSLSYAINQKPPTGPGLQIRSIPDRNWCCHVRFTEVQDQSRPARSGIRSAAAIPV